jgi:homoserine kinase
VLVWCTYEQTGAVIEQLRQAADGWAEVRRVPFESQGADVREL